MRAAVPAILLAAAAAGGQWLERTIWLPDSLGGLEYPEVMSLNTVDNKLYVAGMSGNRIVVIDATTSERVGVIPFSYGGWVSTCYNPAANKVYFVDEDGKSVTVIDCAVDAIVQTLPLNGYPYAVACDPAANRVYCQTETDVGGDLVVIDGKTDGILGTVEVGEPVYTENDRFWLEPDPAHNKVYAAVLDTWGIKVKAVTGSPARVCAEVDLDGVEFYGMDLDSVQGRLVCVVDGDSGSELIVVETASDSIAGTIDLGEDRDAFVDIRYCPGNDRCYDLEDYTHLHVVDIASGRLVESVFLDDEGGIGLELNTDGSGVFCCTDFVLYVVDGEDNQVLAEVELSDPVDLCYNPFDSLVYCLECGDDRVTGVDDEGLIAHKVYTGCDVETAVLDAARGRVYCADRSQDGILVLDARTGAILNTVLLSRSPYLLEMNPEQTKLYCAGSSRLVSVVDLEDDRVIAEVQVGSGIDDICYNPVFDKLYVMCERSEDLWVIDGTTDSPYAKLDLGRTPSALCCDTVSGNVFCADRSFDEVWVIDGACDSVIARLQAGEMPRSLACNASAGKVYCGDGRDGSVIVIDARSPAVLARIPDVGNDIEVLVCDPVRNKLFCMHNGGVTTVDCRADTILARIPIDGPDDIALDRSCNTLFCIQNQESRVVHIDATKDRVRSSAEGLYHPRRLVCSEDWDGLFVVSAWSAIQVLHKPWLDPMAVGESGVSFMGRTINLLGTKPADMIDITGRRVARLKPGLNDLQGLAPGVYFVRRADERTVRFLVTR